MVSASEKLNICCNKSNDNSLKAKNNVKWELLSNGFGNIHNFATRGIRIYNGELYFGTDNFNASKQVALRTLLHVFKEMLKHGNLAGWEQIRYSLKSDGCEVWKYNDTTKEFHQLIGNLLEADLPAGFGDPENSVLAFFKEFKGKLYVGTESNCIKGCEVWRYDGKNWENVVKDGFGEHFNQAAWSVEVFNDHIYIGTSNWDTSRSGFCHIWRSSDGENWSKVVDRGFRDFDTTERTHNRYAWNMEVYKDCLYVSTYNHPALFGHKGGQLLKTSDGLNWSKVPLPGGDGFGENLNCGIRDMVIYNDWLYMGTASLLPQACEIWKYNGNIWIPVIGDDVPGVKFKPHHMYNDGFGNIFNGYAWSMTVSSDNKLWIGTGNIVNGCEIYCYDGTKWTQIVGNRDDSEMPNGFGLEANSGVRSIIEYPVGSSNIFAGTATSWVSPSTCQVWTRKVT